MASCVVYRQSLGLGEGCNFLNSSKASKHCHHTTWSWIETRSHYMGACQIKKGHTLHTRLPQWQSRFLYMALCLLRSEECLPRLSCPPHRADVTWVPCSSCFPAGNLCTGSRAYFLERGGTQCSEYGWPALGVSQMQDPGELPADGEWPLTSPTGLFPRTSLRDWHSGSGSASTDTTSHICVLPTWFKWVYPCRYQLFFTQIH